MEGEKERQMQQREEKESNEAEEDRRSDDNTDNEEDDDEGSEGAALVWQENYGDDNLGLPIMHWEALSLRIAELEKQEEEKRDKRAKVRCLSRLSLCHICGETGHTTHKPLLYHHNSSHTTLLYKTVECYFTDPLYRHKRKYNCGAFPWFHQGEGIINSLFVNSGGKNDWELNLWLIEWWLI